MLISSVSMMISLESCADKPDPVACRSAAARLRPARWPGAARRRRRPPPGGSALGWNTTSVIVPCMIARARAWLQTSTMSLHRLAHRGLAPDLIDDRHAHGHDDAHDGNHDHDLDEREASGGSGDGSVMRGAWCVFRAHTQHALRNTRRDCGLWTLDLDSSAHRAILAVMANMAESTLSRRKPTPTAMTMISTGSIMLVMTRKAMLSSFS